ncbi:MAG: MotA/TolQ/ExbB proton channel family protein [Hyphomicrobiales bacterium]
MTELPVSRLLLAQATPAAPQPEAAPPPVGPEAGAAPAVAPEAAAAPPAAPAAPEAVPPAPAVEVQAEPGGIVDGAVGAVSNFIDLGGPVVALLLVLSVFALTIILLKLWQFYFSSGASRKAVSGAVSLWIAQDYEKALAAVSRLRGPVARVVGFAMAGAASRREEQHLREETEHLAQSEISALRSYLRGLEAVVQVAPLLGLFGTVIGMIEAFQSLQAAGTQVNPADLAGGIWVALLTTAVGLAVAMPVSLVLYWFESHIERVRASMELFVTEVMTNPPVRAVKSQAAEGMRVRLAVAMAAKNAN